MLIYREATAGEESELGRTAIKVCGANNNVAARLYVDATAIGPEKVAGAEVHVPCGVQRDFVVVRIGGGIVEADVRRQVAKVVNANPAVRSR